MPKPGCTSSHQSPASGKESARSDSPVVQPDWSLLCSHPLHCLSLGLGSGLFPKMPGTVGTLLGFPLYGLLAGLPAGEQWLALSLLFVLGVWCCAFTGRALGVSDHGAIVWDESVAMAGVLIMTPSGWVWSLLAFILFRLFDILKPFPIGWVDARIKGGLGVMLDDVLAAWMAVVVLQMLKALAI